MARLTVVGAGVVGLSCAVRLAETGLDVNVLARDLPLETTSAVAGGLWLPEPTERPDDVTRWARATFLHLRGLADAGEAGVRLVPGRVLHHRPAAEPFWAAGMSDLAPVTAVDDPEPGYRLGWRVILPLVHTPTYLTYLTARLKAAGGTLTRMALPALPGQGLVVNCTGVAARALAGDHSVRAVRGEVLVLRDPGVREWTYDGGDGAGPPTYVLPRGLDVVVGGTYDDGEWSPTADPAAGERILARAQALVPALTGAEVLAHKVGIRPARPSVRLEVEHRDGPDGEDRQVIHCYGHGRSGWTLAWGCAQEVLTAVTSLAQSA